MTELKNELTMIAGNMFGGKTSELGSILNQEVYNGKNVQAFLNSLDKRFGKPYMKTHDGATFEKVPTIIVQNTKELMKNLKKNTEIIGIDEIQFFDDYILKFIDENMSKYKIVATGLKLNFRGDSFPLRKRENIEQDSHYNIGDLLTRASEIITKHTGCRYNKNGKICGELAKYPQRFRSDKSLAKYEDPTIVVGGDDVYSPRCHAHFIRPEPESK